ncbi:MAG TPA: PilZ domain-containing protein [Candidatus Angelobacter sp.]|nr:PilZ domain-containing protein [Candidatus Angelobacter sp.]
MHCKLAYSRRLLSRVLAPEDVWVCWQCNGYDDFSRVLDISPHGLFLESSQSKVAVGMSTKLDFLVAEGRIRADAVIRHVRRGAGLGLKFAPLPEPDSTRLRSLLTRLRAS